MKRLLCVAMSVMCFAGIGAAQEQFDGTIRVGGSTTLLPMIADCASQFMEKYGKWDKVDVSLPNKDVLIYVTGGGSGFGVNASISGTVDIGMCSRDLKAEEKTKLGEYKEYLVSKDCVAFAVRKDNPLAKIENLTSADVLKIYSGKAKTFKDVRADLPAKPLLVLMRDMAGGSTEMIQKLVLKTETFTPNALQIPSQGANLKKLESNASAISYLSSVKAMDSDKLKVFKFNGVKPTNEAVMNGSYGITRPLILVVKGEPSKAEQKFIDFVLNEGQAIVEEHGYVPVVVRKASN